MSKFNFSGIQNVTSENGVSIGSILKGVLLAYVVTLVIFLIFAVVITYTSFPEGSIPTVVVITTIVSIIYAGTRVAKNARSKGWLNGAIAGMAYMVILYVASCLALTGFVFDRYVIYMLFLGILAGAFGGIMGINLKGSHKNK